MYQPVLSVTDMHNAAERHVCDNCVIISAICRWPRHRRHRTHLCPDLLICLCLTAAVLNINLTYAPGQTKS